MPQLRGGVDNQEWVVKLRVYLADDVPSGLLEEGRDVWLPERCPSCALGLPLLTVPLPEGKGDTFS